ncbi:MAG: RagB/SusD family nutrient uptake outer membrane protein [Bacteroidales bacterium]|nr:RagB/SusD family nutrient uptake outer membrane protein [Bacteroidales bacterium]
MKSVILYIAGLSLSLFFFASCEESLDPNLYGTITTNNFFQSSSDLDAATTALYHELRLGGWAPYMFSDGSSLVMDEVATGEWTTKWSWTDFLNGNWIINEQMNIGFYMWLSPAVTRCTYTLAKIEESPVEEAVKNKYIAEIKALRAFFVYDLYRLYGPMPLIIEKERALYPDPDYKPERPSSEEVEEFLRTELRDAADLLPVEQNEYGRVTKGAALHYLLKYHMKKKEWSEAVNIANEIIGLNYYDLEPVYEDVFAASNEGNGELIFVVRGLPMEQYGNHTHTNILPGDFASPYGNSVDGWNGHRMPWDFYDTFDPDDKRRALAWAEYENKNGDVINLRDSDIGALPLKYGIDPQASGIWSGSDKILERYAEVLMYKAEALNEINGPQQESIDLINSLRERAFDNFEGTAHELQLSDFSSKEALRDHILLERGWEFWYEGKRREDLIRMGKYITTGQEHASDFGQKNLLWPIPAAVITENSNILQNSGY